MEDTKKQVAKDGKSVAAESRIRESRRRLLRGGLGVSPVLLTLVSRPALGTGSKQCFSPSGFASMPTSVHGTPKMCSGRSPGYWKNWPKKDWPAPYQPTTLFKNVFTPVPTTFLNLTLMQVLEQGGGGGLNDMGRYIVAALLNAQAGLTDSVLPVLKVKSIWTEYASNGRIEVTAGVFWEFEAIKSYLESTWT